MKSKNKIDTELSDLLCKWVDCEENYYGAARSFKINDNPVATGEYRILIKSVLSVNKKNISLEDSFLTVAQADNSFIKSKKGDIYRMKDFLYKFDETYKNKVNVEIDSIVDKLEKSIINKF